MCRGLFHLCKTVYYLQLSSYDYYTTIKLVLGLWACILYDRVHLLLAACSRGLYITRQSIKIWLITHFDALFGKDTLLAHNLLGAPYAFALGE